MKFSALPQTVLFYTRPVGGRGIQIKDVFSEDVCDVCIKFHLIASDVVLGCAACGPSVMKTTVYHNVL